MLYCDTDSDIFIQKGNDPISENKGLPVRPQMSWRSTDLSLISRIFYRGLKNYAFSVFCPSTGKLATKV